MNCKWLEESIRDGFSEWSRVLPLDSGECLVRLPFWNGEGDPIELTVNVEGGRVVINDTGSIAGLLFSLGQDEQGSPAFDLLENLERTHHLEIDFDEGVVKVSVAESNLYDGIAEMAKVLMAVHTVMPHLRELPRTPDSQVDRLATSQPRLPAMQSSSPRVRSLGPRIRTRIERRYDQLDILDFVERQYTLAGAAVSDWPIDFHWSVGSNGGFYEVNVVAADLRVSDPFARAHKVASLSVDTRDLRRSGGDQLRVVVESNDNNPQSSKAKDFLRIHSDELDYRMFDFRQRDESLEFFDLSREELTRGALERN